MRASRLAGRVRRERFLVVGSGPVGERATPTPGQDPWRVDSCWAELGARGSDIRGAMRTARRAHS